MEWAQVETQLSALPQSPKEALPQRYTSWLTTIDADGKPHVTPVGALYVDGAWWFQTGTGTQKAKNIVRDPRCSMAVSTKDLDVVVEGSATQVTEQGQVARLAKAWADQGWPAEPDESGTGITAPYNAPGTGAPPWSVYRIDAKSAALVGTTEETDGARRFHF